MAALDIQYCVDRHHEVDSRLPGHGLAWLGQQRSASLKAFESHGFPTQKDENWKYTNVRPITKSALVFALPDAAADPDFVAVDGLDAYQLVFVDGILSESASDTVPGVQMLSLEQCLNQSPDLLQGNLGNALPEQPHGFSHLNGAFLSCGAVLVIDNGVALDRPIELVFVTSATSESVIQPRNVLIAGEGSEVSVIERYVALNNGRYLNNCITEIYLEPQATVEFSRVVEEAEKASHVGGIFSRQRADSELIVNCISLNGQVIRNDIQLSLDEPGAACHLNGLGVTDNRQHVDNFTQINHNVERCTSRELFKGVLDGRSRNVFHGRIVVAQDAQQTDSEQQNNNLLLSRDAEVDTKPQLEIYADDVKCSHGATVGQLDANSLFYLRSRGIDEETARGMLTFAFADDALRGISQGSLKAYIEKRISLSLGETDPVTIDE